MVVWPFTPPALTFSPKQMNVVLLVLVPALRVPVRGSLMGFHVREPEALVQGGGNPTYRVRSAAERRQLSDQQQQRSYGTTHSTSSTAPTTRAPPESFELGGRATWMMHEADDVTPRATPLQVRYGVSSTEAILEYGDGNSCE